MLNPPDLNILIIGHGEIGRAINNNLKTFRIDYHDPFLGEIAPKKEYRFIHVTFPQPSDDQTGLKYFGSILESMKQFDTDTAIWLIHTSINLNAVRLLQNYPRLVHVPLRGTHGRLEAELPKFKLAIGPFSISCTLQTILTVKEYLEKNGFTTDLYKDAFHTTAAKLWSVSWFHWQLAYVQELFLFCRSHHLDFEKIYLNYQADERTPVDYADLMKGFQPRPKFYPNRIGGKCVMQDTALLSPDLVHPEIGKLFDQLNEQFPKETEL